MVNKEFGLNLTFTQIQAFLKRNQLTNGRNTSFKKGQSPWNKGMKGLDIGGKETQFKKGQRPVNYRPIGSEMIDKEGYTRIKISDHGTYPQRWKLKHRILWENINGPIPEGHALIFADGDKRNIDLDNLILVSRQQLARINQHSLISSDAELTKTGVILAEIMTKVGELRK